MIAGFVNESAWCAPPPPAFQLLNWIHVIYQTDSDAQEHDAEHAFSSVLHESAAYNAE
jgi:hypothetical protein